MSSSEIAVEKQKQKAAAALERGSVRRRQRGAEASALVIIQVG